MNQCFCDKIIIKKETPNNFLFGVGHRILSYVGLAKTLRLHVSLTCLLQRLYRPRFPLVSTRVATSIKSSPIVYDNHTFRLNLLNYYLPLQNLADSLNPCPGTRTFLVKTEGLGVLSISSLVFLPKELGDFQFNRSETSPFILVSSINEKSNIVSL